jgi:hypothetical protein
MRRRLIAGLLLLAMPAAHADDTVSGDKAAYMVADVVVMRPLGLAATVLGAALTVVALPFTIPSGSVEESVQAFIVKPAEYTFKRPLGDFGDDSGDRH